MRDQTSSFMERLFTPYNGLKVSWFDAWDSALDEALQALPEIEACPHELYRLLMQNPTSARKRTALVTKDGEPVAVVGLRQTGRYTWEPITQWIVPGMIFPARPDFVMPALESLRKEILVAWWRMENAPSQSPLVRYLETTPTYRIHCADDIEQYWHDHGFFKTIRTTRKRCKDFTITINAPGSAEWTIKNWEAKWRQNPQQVDLSLPDRIAAAKYLEEQKQYYTLMLADKDVPIGGATVCVHQKDLVAGVLYYDQAYRNNGAGNRLIELSVMFAIENGYEFFDIGGGHEYKKRWAPQSGERWWFNICPEPLYRAREFVQWGRKTIRRGSAAQERQPSVTSVN
jgi:hypothetical protein